MLKNFLTTQQWETLQAEKSRRLVEQTRETTALPGRLTLAPDDPVGWIHEHFRIPETDDRRLHLDPYQAACLREALRRNETGKFVYSVILWSDIKKSIKSTIAAAVILWRAYHTAWGQFLIVANDLKQADSRVGYYFRRAIELNATLRGECKVRNYKVEMSNHAFIEAIPIDPSGEAGGNADMVTFSELWGAHQTAQKRMWTETTLPPFKFGYSQRWIETYAGFSGESELLEQLYQTGVNQGRQIVLPDAPEKLEVFANDTARLFALWNTQPRLPWQTDAYYAQEEAILTPEEFARVHRNQWARGQEAFVPPDWWDACGKSPFEDVRHDEPVILSADAGVISDCFAVVMVTRRGESVQVQYARKWQPEGTLLDFRPIEAEIRRLLNAHNVIELAYDEYQLVDMMGRIRAEEATNVRRFNQASPRAVADKRLYDLIRDRRIQHRNEPALREHILVANRKPEDDNKLRLVKRRPNDKIDLAVALSMAADRSFAYALDE